MCAVALGAAVGVWGCEGPESFLRNDAGFIMNGSGGDNFGVGGGAPGLGGMGVGGMLTVGSGGRGTGGMGTGGMNMGSGGRGTGGMNTGSGGRGTGGMNTGSGGRGTGGSLVGTGGRGTGGSLVGTGGSLAGTGGRGTGGTVPGTGGAVGTNPCAGICTDPIQIVSTANYNTGDLPVTPTCHETTATFQGGGVSNFFVGMRTLQINNGAAIAADGQFLPPARRNGGYCFETSSGTVTYSRIYLF